MNFYRIFILFYRKKKNISCVMLRYGQFLCRPKLIIIILVKHTYKLVR